MMKCRQANLCFAHSNFFRHKTLLRPQIFQYFTTSTKKNRVTVHKAAFILLFSLSELFGTQGLEQKTRIIYQPLMKLIHQQSATSAADTIIIWWKNEIKWFIDFLWREYLALHCWKWECCFVKQNYGFQLNRNEAKVHRGFINCAELRVRQPSINNRCIA
jgi:hypothetical protein